MSVTAGGSAHDPPGDAELLALSPAVARARAEGTPIVALESSVLAQGLPIPANRAAHERTTAAVMAEGAVPAVTAVIEGRPTLGLEGAALERFLRRDGVTKVSARDLPWSVTRGADGATTVAASLAVARSARIPVFATGGIGGVHREPPFDESADLYELARSPLVVVCAGAKAILDLPATMERLETLGVTVVGFGTDELPGFFSAGSGIALSARVDSVEDVAQLHRVQRQLGLPGALLVVQPPPASAALDRREVDDAVAGALAAARREGIRGAAVTPYLLSAVERATGGRSLEVNLALLEANARLAARIAVALQGAPSLTGVGTGVEEVRNS